MKKHTYLLLCLIFSAITLQAQTKKDLDRQAIKDMCGCYEVTFKYTETFSPEIDYEQKLDYTAYGFEWATLIEDEPNELSIQHLLIVNDTTIIKHWRQDWVYENEKVFYYDHDNTWDFKELPSSSVAGQWTQKVFQVDDSPRYSGSATWIHADGKHYWENTTDSPLPRREYSKRDDYNVMKRGNRQEITDYGWLHEQDNEKVIRKDGEDAVLVQEKGYNIYTKVDDSKCKPAQDWWKENQALWEKVRNVWDEVYETKGKFSLKKEVDGKPMFVHFFALKNDTTEAEIKALIEKFINS